MSGGESTAKTKEKIEKIPFLYSLQKNWLTPRKLLCEKIRYQIRKRQKELLPSSGSPASGSGKPPKK